MNQDGLERQLRAEARGLRERAASGHPPPDLERRILAAVQTQPPAAPFPLGRALAALLLVAAAGAWAADRWWPAGRSSPVVRTTTATRQAWDTARGVEQLGEALGQAAMGTVERALLAEVANWQQDAQVMASQLWDGIPSPMRRLLPLPPPGSPATPN